MSDGSAVLGLGNIGPRAAMPVMEGKAMLFKEFAGVDAFPICLDTQDPDEIVATVKAIAPGFGGINLEDISAPRCFEIEDRLKAELDIPVFHDDQHGTAVVVLAALLNALTLTGQRIGDVRVVSSGSARPGSRSPRSCWRPGCATSSAATRAAPSTPGGADYLDGTMPGGQAGVGAAHQSRAAVGTPVDVLEGADLLIGLSGARVVPAAALERDEPRPDRVRDGQSQPRGLARGGAAATCGSWRPAARTTPTRSTTCSASPACSAARWTSALREITETMKTAAARAIADIVSTDELREDYIIPSVFNREVVGAVAAAVAEEARESGAAEAGRRSASPPARSCGSSDGSAGGCSTWCRGGVAARASPPG